MKLVFFGTPDYVILVLDSLKNAGYEIAAVVTQPPKPVGKKHILTSSPTALWAKKHGVKIFDGKPKEIIEELRILKGELGVLGAYGRILPPELLTIFPHGIINIHPSLLPKYRGASPVQAAIATREKQTGVTIINLDEELDHGPIISQFTEDIREDDTAGSLRQRLFEKASEVLVNMLPAYLENRVEPREQEHEKATYTTLLKKEYGFIPPKYIDAILRGETIQKPFEIPFIKNYYLILNSYSLARLVRALDPWPGAWTEVKVTGNTAQVTRRLKILEAHAEGNRLVPDSVQLEGKKLVSWEQFKKGYPEARF